MKIKIEGFLGQNHSWSIVQQNLARQLINYGHEVHLRSTNGWEYFPNDLNPFKKEIIDNEYDLQISYTAMINFPAYLANGKKNRFGIWNYEFTIIPDGFAKYYKATDLMLPSSKFSYDVFLKNKIPAEHMKIVPHGVNFEEIQNAEPYPLKTKKRIKFFANIAQPHIRKNISGMLEAYGKAFTTKDDVCFILKVVDKPPKHSFELKFSDLFANFKAKYKNHAEIEIIRNFIPNIYGLYKAADILFMIPHCECYHLPSIEMLANKKIVISSNYGGQLDFLNNKNSILIDGKMIRAPKQAHYWSASAYSHMFQPSIDDAIDKLRNCVNNFESIQENIKTNIDDKIFEVHSWSNVAKEIISLCQI